MLVMRGNRLSGAFAEASAILGIKGQISYKQACSIAFSYNLSGYQRKQYLEKVRDAFKYKLQQIKRGNEDETE
jgi:hypothetical protein